MPKKPNFTAKLKLETGTHSAFINQLRASPDGKTLASSSIDKTIRLWDVPAQKQTGMLLGQMGAGNEGAIQAFSFSRDGKYIVSLAWMYPDDRQDQNERETELRVYELATGNLQAGFRYPGTLQDLDFSLDGKYLALAGNPNQSRRGLLMVHKTKDLLKGFGKKPEPFASTVLYESGLVPSYVRFVPEKPGKGGDYRIIASAWEPFGYRPGRLSSFSFSISKKLTGLFSRDLEEWIAPDSLAVSRQFIVISPADFDENINKKFYCYDLDGKLVNVVDSESPPANPAFSSDGNRLIVGQRRDSSIVQIKVYDTAFGQFPLKSVYFGHDSQVFGVALPGGDLAVSAGGDQNALHFWSTEHMEGEFIAESKGVGRVVHVVGVSPNEQIGFGTRDTLRLDDGRIVLQRVFDLRTMTLRSFPFHEAAEFRRAEKAFGKQSLDFSEQGNWNLLLLPNGSYFPVPSGDWYNVSTYGFTEKGSVVIGSQDGKLRFAPRSPEGTYQLSERVLVGHEASVIDHAACGKWLVTAGADQVMRLWFLEDAENDTGEHLCPALNLFVGADDEWVIWSESGYYNASQDGDMRFGYHLNRGPEMEAVFIPSDRLSKTFYRPDIIQAIVEHGNEKRALEELAKEGIQIGKVDVIDALPPIVEFLKGGVRRTKREVTFRFSVQNLSPKNPVRRVWIVQNEGFVWEAKKIAKNYTVKLRLKPGWNGFKILAENDAAKSIPLQFEAIGPGPDQKQRKNSFLVPFTSRGVEQTALGRMGTARGAPEAEEAARSQANIFLEGRENGTLYLLAVGVSKLKNETDDFKSLTYADDDAESMYNAFARSMLEGTLKNKGALKNKAFKSVEASILLNEQATKEAIFKEVDAICEKIRKRKAKNDSRRDVLMVFLSGHGVRRSDAKERELYFWCYDLLKTSTRATGLSFIELGEKITALPVDVILATDACHSGMAGSEVVRGVDPNELAKRIYAINERGIYILNAARSEEFAREHPSIGHGVFTKAVLEALEFESDFSMLNIMASVQRRVLHYTNGIQTPVFRMYGDLLPLVVYEK
ncbi:MAG: caspase family protein [Anaerolineales bacterium]|nr:caspase family protein [Anaerolineales bacterium]